MIHQLSQAGTPMSVMSKVSSPRCKHKAHNPRLLPLKVLLIAFTDEKSVCGDVREIANSFHQLLLWNLASDSYSLSLSLGVKWRQWKYPLTRVGVCPLHGEYTKCHMQRGYYNPWHKRVIGVLVSFLCDCFTFRSILFLEHNLPFSI